ncbi:MAG: M20/M25/M40 family metallo-hydrolase [Gammaproteobacteria bacterium]|nr:M20/M25/M40 family metallo-hydrolase [Gammaproteobacteria bacterium]
MDQATVQNYVSHLWDDAILPALTDFIRIPNKSPAFDPDWSAHGHMERAVSLIEEWLRAHALPGTGVEVVRLQGRTPLIFVEIPGTALDTAGDCVLLYGHLDKQPEMSGWRADLGPWKPVREGERLYGRGGADDGYAAFASLAAVHALREQGLPHARCVILIEACEESGSYDLPHYIDALAERIGEPNLVICLDSGCGNYEQLWCTTSLRGIVAGTLTVETLTEGVHSGDASGIVPCTVRVLRQLLSRLEDPDTGRILPEVFQAEIPAQRREQAQRAARVLADAVYTKFPFLAGVRPVSEDPLELVLNRTWRAALSVVGADGLPPPADAGNVTRPMTAFKLSLRTPPTCPVGHATRELKKLLEADPPYGAKVHFEPEASATGWNAPELASWLAEATERASRAYFDREAVYMGEGGSIPFMGMLGEKFPDAQFLITGVLGPGSNAHGPNEFLHIPMAKKLTCCVADILHDHHRVVSAAP